MKLVTYALAGKEVPGIILDGGRILNLREALAGEGGPAIDELLDVITGGPAMLEAVRDAAARASGAAGSLHCVAQGDVRLLAPLPHPRKNIFCVGRNYKEHVEEAAKARGNATQLPEFPQFFTKPPLSVIGPDAEIPWHAEVTQQLDYEVELGVIIGRQGRNIPRDKALDYIFGYTVINDITARDLQKRHGQWFKGKGLDGSCPMGPWIVDRASVPDPQQITVRLRVNGEVRQESNTSMMIFDLKEIISQLSAGLTLEPGDVIATGTPSGVGFAMTPPRFLGDGDVVETEVEGVGLLRNVVRRVAHEVAR